MDRSAGKRNRPRLKAFIKREDRQIFYRVDQTMQDQTKEQKIAAKQNK